MPHAGDDLASADEVKVYKDEGEEEQRSSENLSEDKIGLVTETEEVIHHYCYLNCYFCYFSASIKVCFLWLVCLLFCCLL